MATEKLLVSQSSLLRFCQIPWDEIEHQWRLLPQSIYLLVYPVKGRLSKLYFEVDNHSSEDQAHLHIGKAKERNKR